ncbi:MAG: metallopeptidase TldD-related protein [Bacilli bacterium]
MIKELIEKCYKENIIVQVNKRKENNTSIEVFNDKINAFNTGIVYSYLIKALINNKTITINVENIEDTDSIIRVLKENIILLDNNNVNAFAKNEKIHKINKKPLIIDYNQVKEDLISLNTLKDEYKLISNITLYFDYNEEDIEITNKDISICDTNSYISFDAEIIATKNDVNYTKRVSFNLKSYNFNKIKSNIIKNIKELCSSIDQSVCKTSKYNIILTNECVIKLLSTFKGMFLEENIYKKTSILESYYNKKVFSDKISVLDEPLNKKFITTRSFDNEGMPTYNKIVVDKGVFVNKLYNNEYAIKNNVKSTGNSFGAYNLSINKGETSFSSMKKILNDGIIINNLEGMHSGVNILNGEFSLLCEGYIIKNNKKVKTLKDIIISSNLITLFNSITLVGSDINYSMGLVAAPSLMIKDVTITGSEE